ncbi:MAG TPA: DUF4149 domain-containing protein [Terriglobales bacterium]|jgi:hypothetical protein
MSLLRFLMLLSLGVWLGALIFFPVVAQISFSVLPSAHLAGLVVRDSLIKLHWIGIACGIAFLICSVAYNYGVRGRARTFAATHLLAVLMLILTAISQFRIIPRMDALRVAGAEISSLPTNNPIRTQFDSLHVWSVRIEAAVLVLGLLVLYSVARRWSSSRP